MDAGLTNAVYKYPQSGGCPHCCSCGCHGWSKGPWYGNDPNIVLCQSGTTELKSTNTLNNGYTTPPF